LNSNGASNVSNAQNTQTAQDIGKALLKTALLLQLAIMCFFLGLAGYFHWKCSRAGLLPQNLKDVLITLYCSCLLITIRTIFRSVEYFAIAQIHATPDFDPTTISQIIRYEWYFWVFEAILMLANSLLLNVRHPARFLPRNNKIYLAEDGVTEIEGPGYEDPRPWWMTFIDPFDVVGLCKGRDKKARYWETHQRSVVMEEESESKGANATQIEA
jgi:hypothetical protein